MARSHEVVIIGGGHNGLTVAGYLAKAGVDVCVVEALPKVGGGVITIEPVAPGFKMDFTPFNIFSIKSIDCKCTSVLPKQSTESNWFCWLGVKQLLYSTPPSVRSAKNAAIVAIVDAKSG